MTTLLAGDIGGTKTLLSLYRCDASSLEAIASERYPSADWGDLAAMVRHFLAAVDPANLMRPAAACFAVAGPVRDRRAQLTNLPWRLSEAELAADCAIRRVELVNDFAVLLYGLPHLQSHQRALIHAGETNAAAPLLILGAGTGLGVAIGIPSADGLQVVASEAAHASFAPLSQAEWELREWLRQDLQVERVSIERVVSGTGLGQVARWLLSRRHPDGDHPLSPIADRWAQPKSDSPRDDLPAGVAAAAAGGDPLAVEALELWLGAYGAVTGDLALTTLCGGGIWLAGGTAAKVLPGLRSPHFRQAFLAKGRLRAELETIPINALIDPAVGSFSAACRARMLMG